MTAMAAHGVLVGVRCVRVVEAVFAVVGGSFGRVAEDVVGGGDAGEALACVWVGAVAVWVVAEGEGVEFSGWDWVSWVIWEVGWGLGCL